MSIYYFCLKQLSFVHNIRILKNWKLWIVILKVSFYKKDFEKLTKKKIQTKTINYRKPSFRTK
jgi:hypothetical protein